MLHEAKLCEDRGNEDEGCALRLPMRSFSTSPQRQPAPRWLRSSPTVRLDGPLCGPLWTLVKCSVSQSITIMSTQLSLVRKFPLRSLKQDQRVLGLCFLSLFLQQSISVHTPLWDVEAGEARNAVGVRLFARLIMDSRTQKMTTICTAFQLPREPCRSIFPVSFSSSVTGLHLE